MLNNFYVKKQNKVTPSQISKLYIAMSSREDNVTLEKHAMGKKYLVLKFILVPKQLHNQAEVSKRY